MKLRHILLCQKNPLTRFDFCVSFVTYYLFGKLWIDCYSWHIRNAKRIYSDIFFSFIFKDSLRCSASIDIFWRLMLTYNVYFLHFFFVLYFHFNSDIVVFITFLCWIEWTSTRQWQSIFVQAINWVWTISNQQYWEMKTNQWTMWMNWDNKGIGWTKKG